MERIDGEELSVEEIVSFVRLLVPAGVESTYRSISTLLFALLTQPDQLGLLFRVAPVLPVVFDV